MGRLIDADELVKMVDKHTNDDMTLDDDITCILENVQTAYDVDKVMEELKELRTELLYSTDYENEIMNYCLDWMDDAIEIVKNGGK